MEESNPIKQIVHLYFGKHFSRYGQILFGRWFRAEAEEIEKTELLQELWTRSSAEATDVTRHDWYALQKQLQIKPVFSLYRPWIRYAAMLACVMLAGTTVFWVADRSKQVRSSVEMVELFVPYGESREVVLPDSSKVWLDAGSLLIYPKEFTMAGTRTLYLSGEASFMVRKNPTKPFIVKTTYLAVQALGTVFSVESYPNDSCTTATLEEGSVRVEIKGGIHEPSLLKPDQQLVYSHTSHTVTVQSVDASLYKMERSGYLIFEQVSFSRLIASLERKFNVTVYYNSRKYADAYYNVKFAPDETLEDVLNVLKQLVGIQYKIKDQVVFIN